MSACAVPDVLCAPICADTSGVGILSISSSTYDLLTKLLSFVSWLTFAGIVGLCRMAPFPEVAFQSGCTCSGMVGAAYSTKEPSVLPLEEGTNRYFFPATSPVPDADTLPDPSPGKPLSPRGIVSESRYFGWPSVVVPSAVSEAEACVPGLPVVTVPNSSTGVFPSVPGLPLSPLGNTRLILYLGFPEASVPFAVTVADADSPLSTVPISKEGVFPSSPSVPGLPLSPLGRVRLILYFGLPDESVPFAVTLAEAEDPWLTVPISNTGVLPLSPLSPLGRVRLILYFGLPEASVPFAVTAAEAEVPCCTVPISNAGVLPSWTFLAAVLAAPAASVADLIAAAVSVLRFSSASTRRFSASVTLVFVACRVAIISRAGCCNCAISAPVRSLK